MAFLRCITFIALSVTLGCNSKSVQYEDHAESLDESGSCDKPLILTPYIEEGKIEEAQKMARVHLEGSASNVISYSGYFTVNKKCNSNIYFWFFPSRNNLEEAPVTLWLQGGPGCSSMFGLFQENGPLTVNNQNEVQLRNNSWNSVSSLLYIDNPVGSGFSFTDDKDECYVNNEDEIRKYLLDTLVQFFKLFPKLQKNDFYIFGESYAGKYIPAIAYSIHEYNQVAKIKINLKGLGIGDGFSDPENMLVYSDYVYQLGLVDEIGKNIIHQLEESIRLLIKQKKWKEASDGFGNIIALIAAKTGNISIYNYSKMKNSTIGNYANFIKNKVTRCAIHVSNIPYNNCSKVVWNYLINDIGKSVKPWIEILLENYPILFYNGQFDIIVAYPLTRNFINTLAWSGSDEFKKSPRFPFSIESQKLVCGYIRSYKNLTLALVRNAGHMVPQDQPECALELYKRFILGRKNMGR